MTRSVNIVQRDTRHPAADNSITRTTKGCDKKARHRQLEVYINPAQSERDTQPHSDSQHTSRPLPASTDIEMAAQDADTMMMTVSQLERQVGNGTYIFRRPLTIVQCAVQDKYIVYPSCQQCNKRVSPENNGYVCPIHRWQRGVVYQFAMRILLQDAIGSEMWATLFNAKAVQVLGFTANDYMSMKGDAERYAALDMLRGAQVMVTVRKREAGQYVNYTVSDMEIVTV